MFTLLFQQLFSHRIHCIKQFSSCRHCARETNLKEEYKKCFKILELPEHSDAEQVRLAYIRLAKKLHPDSPQGNLEHFQKVDYAFRTLLQKQARQRWDVDDDDDDDEGLRHPPAPQHRQYLSNEGVGSGTPFEREKQFQQKRVLQATESLHNHRMNKALASDQSLMQKESALKHKIQTKCGVDGFVEDLIQASMSRGDFSHLSGAGKPLADRSGRNVYTDFTTHKINQILIENGFSPEWIALQKDIRSQIDTLRADMARMRANPQKESEWMDAVQAFDAHVKEINTKIDKFNLVVPILHKQMVHVDLQREADRILVHTQSRLDPDASVMSKDNYEKDERKETKGIWQYLNIFR